MAVAAPFPKITPSQHAALLSTCEADSLLKLMRLFMSTPVCSVQITKGHLLRSHKYILSVLDLSTAQDYTEIKHISHQLNNYKSNF